jgi:DNA replication protein DnaC
MLEQEKAAGKQGRLALSLMHMDIVILDELGYLPFSQAGGALLFHLLSKIYMPLNHFQFDLSMHQASVEQA